MANMFRPKPVLSAHGGIRPGKPRAKRMLWAESLLASHQQGQHLLSLDRSMQCDRRRNNNGDRDQYGHSQAESCEYHSYLILQLLQLTPDHGQGAVT